MSNEFWMQLLDKNIKLESIQTLFNAMVIIQGFFFHAFSM